MRCSPLEIREFSHSKVWLDIQDKLQDWCLDCMNKMAAGDTTVEEWRHLRGVVEAIGNVSNIVEWLCPTPLEDLRTEQEQTQEEEQ